MDSIVNKIGYAMSLRTPQKEALSYLAAISENCDYQRTSKFDAERIASENCEGKHPINIAEEFDFPSFCFSMATGIGKTRLMGACIYYLYKTKGYKHFFILAPGSTIYEKMRQESKPGHPKYIFKGLEAEMGEPKIYDGENYTSYPTRYEQQEIRVAPSSEIEIFIFNIGKIFNSKTDTQFKFHKFHEDLGMSFADVLASFKDLAICMDEAHRYYAPASMKAINYLQPILGLEYTATPKNSNQNIIYSYELARGAVEGYLKTPVVMGRSNTAGYSTEDIEEMKIRDGLTLHEHRKAVVKQYCDDHNLPYVKPIVLIACKDTDHARKIRSMIDSGDFNGGSYIGKVIEIHSNMKGDETEENVRKLLSIERNDNPIEIVLHVYKLKEGWDVNNLFTIIPLNAAKSDILALQTIGRGLRLPFGQITGNEELDTLDIVAHDHYRELVEEIKNSDVFRYRDLDKSKIEPSVSVDVFGSIDDEQLSFFDQAVANTGIKTFSEVDDPAAQEKLYAEYLKLFGAAKVKPATSEDGSAQTSLFDMASHPNEESAPIQLPVIQSEAKSGTSSVRPLNKDDFVKKVKDYSVKAISVPKILVQTSSTVTFKHFAVQRTIADFDIAAAKIERFDVVNQQLLNSIDAQALEVTDAINTLACMLLDSINELSYDDADFILEIVNGYLNQIEGTEEEKRKIVRRYAIMIVDDIRNQIEKNTERSTYDVHIIQKDLIVFRKFVRSVKKDGTVRFDKPFPDKSNIRKYLFSGYKKAYYPENAFDSDTERLFSIILEEDPDVIRWIKPPLNQLGLFWQAGQQYNPDFLVETSEGKFMVEVKASNETRNPEVVTKAREGIKWCRFASTADPDHKMWQYRMIIEDHVYPGNSCKYTLGTAVQITEE